MRWSLGVERGGGEGLGSLMNPKVNSQKLRRSLSEYYVDPFRKPFSHFWPFEAQVLSDIRS